MTHDILSVKLYELDKAIGQMHSRIEQGEMDCPEQVEKDPGTPQRMQRKP